jgi:hypothetical protein
MSTGETMKDFLIHNFDKLLLTALIVTFLITNVASHGTAGEFAIRTMDTLIGALVGIITGSRIAATQKHDEPPKST